MSDAAFEWGGEHFCKPDATHLYHAEPQRIGTHGFPVQLDATPAPPTFCSRCLKWFDDPHHLTAVDHLPPEQGDTHA